MIITLTAYANGTTYYVARTGNDNNSGTSWASAWKTVSKINNSISSGDTVYFGSGEWLQSQLIPVPGNSLTDKTVYACSTYSMESANLATIYSGDSVGNWTQHSGNIYRANWVPSAFAPGFYHEVGGGFAHFPCVIGGDSIYTSRFNISDVNHPGYFYYDYNNDVLYIYPYRGGDPDVTGERILASARRGAVQLPGGCRYTEFFGLNFKMGFGGAVVFTEESGIKQSLNSFIHCVIAHSNAGGVAPYGNNSSIISMGGYGSATNPDTLDGFAYGNVFRGCTIYSATADMGHEGSTHAGSGCTFYGMRQSVFDSCYFSQVAGAAVMWKGGGLDYYGNRVSFCTFDGTEPMPYGRPSFTKLGVEHACGADRDSVYGCIFKNFNNTPAIGIAEADCNWANSVYYAGDFFGNNTLYNCHRFFAGHAEPPEPGYDPITIKYNVMYEVINSSSQFVRSSNIAPIFENPNYCEIDSNYWYDPAYGFVFYDQSGVNRNWSYWTGTMGYDNHSHNSDPGLADPANDDFSRPEAQQEMYRFYGGKLWTKFGAIQGTPEPDTTAPELNNIHSTDTTSNSVNIRWGTDERANSQVDYGTSSNYGLSTPLDPALVFNHVQTITGLSPLTTYHYRVRSSDAAGNESVSGDFTFTTLAPDTIPPVISGVEADNVTGRSALIGWTTNEISTSQVNYGFTTGYGHSTLLSPALVTNHSVLLTNLESDTLYHFRVRSSDAAGNETVSGDFTFHTDSLIISEWEIISIGCSTTVSSTYQGYSPVAINDSIINPDGGTSSTWASDDDPSMSQWVEFNFPASAEVAGVVIYWAWNSYSSSWMCSQEYRLQYRDEGGSFVDIQTVQNPDIDSVSATLFDTTVTTNSFRYYQPANMGPPNYPAVVWLTELEVYGEMGIPAPDPIGTVILDETSAMVIADPVNIQTPVFYQFALDVDSTYPDPWVEPATLVDTVVSTTYGGLTPEYTYFWKIRAIALDQSDTSNWSWSESFNMLPTNSQNYTYAFPDSYEEITSRFIKFSIVFDSSPNSVYFEIDRSIDFNNPFTALVTDIYQGTASWEPETGQDSAGIRDIFRSSGQYYWRASTDGVNWITFPFELKLNSFAYPVPFRPSDGHSQITFTNLPENSRIVIATVSGATVYTETGVGPEDWLWDVKNDKGRDLASGVYLFAVDSKGGGGTGKLVVIR